MASVSIPPKKQRERMLFDLAANLVTVWPSGLVDDAGENPDLIVSGEFGSYGVEVTENIRPEEKRRLRFTQRICEDAHKLYLKKGGLAGTSVTVNFMPDLTIGKSEISEATLQLFTIVESYTNSNPTTVACFDTDSDETFRSRWFLKVWINFHPKTSRSIWQPATAFWVPPLSESQIQEIVSSKEKKVSSYRSRVRDVWLLLVVDGFDGASAASVKLEALGAEYLSSFNGVVLFEFAMNRATVLTIQAASAST